MMSPLSLRDRILVYLECHGSAAPRDIAAGLGDGIDAVLVRQTLGRMLRSAVVRKVSYGNYALHRNYKHRSRTVESDTQDLIHGLLTDWGGFALTREIHEAAWGGERGKSERPYDYMRVQRALRQSDRIRQDFRRGVWNLSPEEIAALPVPGRWIPLLLDMSGLEDLHGFFQTVGGAFSDARDELTLADVCADPDVGALLNEMGRKSPQAHGKALSMLRRDTGSDESDDDVCCYLYWLFEAGDLELHMAAPSSFYGACSRKYGVCAAGLSRGIILKCETEKATVVESIS